MLKKTISLIISILVSIAPVLALELDTSVDDEIRKHYDPSRLESDQLPSLPKTEQPEQGNSTSNSTPSSGQTPSVPKTPPVTPPAKPQIGVKKLPNSSYNPKLDKSLSIRVKKGTKFRVKSSAAISDTTREGARLRFISLRPVTQRYVTIPEGTVFNAVITDSHPPQATGNGGLIVLMVESMNFKGHTYAVHAKITKANHKKIFVNNIKGERKYAKGIISSTKFGRNFYKKSMRGTTKLAQNPWTFILTPFTVVAGIVVYGVNIVGAPIFAIFSKGGHITIPAGSEFEIKLLEDVYLD